MCLTNPRRKVMQNVVNVQAYKHILRKEYLAQQSGISRNNFYKSQGTRSFLRNVKVRGYLTAIRSIPVFHIFIVRSNFPSKILKEIHNNHYGL